MDDDSQLSAPDSKAGRLQRACLKLLLQHKNDGALPTNGRFLYYELEQIGVIPKKYRDAAGNERRRTPQQDVSDATMHLRTVGLVPWSWILDESRDVTNPSFHDTVYEYTLESVGYARIDAWAGLPPPLIVCESRAVKGVLSNLTYEYLVPIVATGGQCGGFLVTDVVPLLVDNDRPVLYIGDHEIRGPADQIEANTRRYLEAHAGRSFDDFTWKRIALTQAQVDANPRLTELVIEKLDRRYKPPRKYSAVECEAVGQVELTRLVRAHLDALLPEPLADVRVREQEQREEMAAILRRAMRRRR